MGHVSPAVAVVGHSFGARSALLFTMQHPELRGLVSLEDGIGTSNGIAPLRRSVLYDSARAAAKSRGMADNAWRLLEEVTGRQGAGGWGNELRRV